ncbi:hypothetical protein BS47DRAFT_1343986 [Hydnum rufescens UP504]|uniref:Uncharacterized protein n=1 Tax=Hydnum rufescens UP504 TaxID=1448309 RepID=A0A9P6AXJ4_9AGAM|nr:hypothetical protein BS47DRAFT_1343986 [Hydnum rufescens UP504]
MQEDTVSHSLCSSHTISLLVSHLPSSTLFQPYFQTPTQSGRGYLWLGFASHSRVQNRNKIVK